MQENGGWSEAQVQLCAGEWWVVRGSGTVMCRRMVGGQGSGTVMCRRMVGGQRLSYVQENGGWSEAQVQLCAGEWLVVVLAKVEAMLLECRSDMKKLPLIKQNPLVNMCRDCFS